MPLPVVATLARGIVAKAASRAVLAARGQRAAVGLRTQTNTKWFIKQAAGKVNLSMEKRVRIATEMVKSKVVRNISRPVTKAIGPRGGRVILNRSKPGEFPKADTTLLMKSIFSDVRKHGHRVDGYIGTPLDYGLILETKMNRSFLERTIKEERNNIRKILTKKIR